jgi:hypothetical protein
MDESKGLFRSVTFWAVVASIIARFCQAYGITPEVANEWGKLAIEFGPLAAGLVADGFSLYGRMRAKTALLITTPMAETAPAAPPPPENQTGVT